MQLLRAEEGVVLEAVDVGALGTGGAVGRGAVPAQVGAFEVVDEEPRAGVDPYLEIQ